MNLLQKEAGSEPYPIIIEASDGLGNTFKETAKTAKFKINYVQPETPSIEYDEVSEIDVKNREMYDLEVYSKYISDLESVRNINMMDFNLTHHITRFDTKVGWEVGDDTTLYGLPTLIKLVNKDKDTGMYSDATTVIYAPLKFGHVLEVNSTDKDGIANIPYSFLQKQYLTKQTVNSDKKVMYNGNNGVNGGVQLTRQAGARSSNINKGIKFVYFPSGGKDKEDANELSRFGGRSTMYLKIKSTDNDPVASITYIPDLEGEKFYFEYDRKLYIGQFSSTDDFSSDSSSYILESTVSVDVISLESGLTNSLVQNGSNINFGSSLPYQPIYNGIMPKSYQDKLDALNEENNKVDNQAADNQAADNQAADNQAADNADNAALPLP
jgi:hypothetical protein